MQVARSLRLWRFSSLTLKEQSFRTFLTGSTLKHYAHSRVDSLPSMTVPFVKVTHNGVVREETLSLSYIIRSLEWNDDEGKRRSLPIRDLRMFLRSSKSDQLLVFMTDRANRSLLNSASVSSRPSIMPRPKSGCYFLDVGDIKLLCRQEQVLVVDNGSALSQHFINSLCKGIKAVEDSKISPSPESNEAEVEHLPFELQVLETALACVTEKYYRQLGSAAPLLEAVIESTIDNPTDYQSYGRLTALKKSIFGFAQHVQACLSAVQDLLGNNRDMADLYLSDPEDREESDHDEAELLLEAYASELTLIQMKALAMLAQIDDTVEHINMDLNGQRNRIIRLSLIMEMLAVTAGSGALVGSIFGMNLLSGYENHPDAFYYITGCTSLFMITMLSMLSARFRRHVITNTNRVNQSSFKHIFKIIDEVESKLASKEALSREDMVSLMTKVSGKPNTGEVELLFGVLDKNLDSSIEIHELHKSSSEGRLKIGA